MMYMVCGVNHIVSIERVCQSSLIVTHLGILARSAALLLVQVVEGALGRHRLLVVHAGITCVHTRE